MALEFGLLVFSFCFVFFTPIFAKADAHVWMAVAQCVVCARVCVRACVDSHGDQVEAAEEHEATSPRAPICISLTL